MALIGKLRGLFTLAMQADPLKAILGIGLARIAARGQGGARLASLLRALPLPVMALGTGAVLLASVMAPDAVAQGIAALSALPDGVWWALVTLGAALFGLKLQVNEQAFAQSIAAPTPPLVAEADPASDAALALSLGDYVVRDNPALSICLAGLKDHAADPTSLTEN